MNKETMEKAREKIRAGWARGTARVNDWTERAGAKMPGRLKIMGQTVSVAFGMI